MTADLAIDLAREMLRLCVLLCGPLLAAALLAGLVSGVLQAATQVHEQTLSFVPKLVAVTLAVVAGMPWLVAHLLEYTTRVIASIPQRL